MALLKHALALGLAFTSVCAALLNSTVLQACNELSGHFPNRVAYGPADLTHPNPSNLNFTYTVTHYWNAAHGQLVPTCVLYPTNASDVAFAVQVLNKYPDVPWAAKAGGHNPNKDWSSVASGILISFRPFMQGITYNADGTADVQPGSRWSEAVSTLEPNGRAVVGGRIGDVGVGGYTLGGGLSFLSAQYGFACDQVVEYEVVLADGTVTKANSNTNTDLFYALKGGGNQFAIVTKFKMNTVPIGQVWGGLKTYSGDKASAIVNATHDFAVSYPDIKAAIIPTFETLLDTLATVLYVFYFYNGPTVPKGVFDAFDAIEALSDSTKVQSYADLLSANNAINLYGFNYLIRAQTIPLLDGDSGRDVFQYQVSSFKSYAAQTQSQNLDLMVYSFAMQPLPVAIQKASLNTGAKNTFAFDVADGDRIWMEYDVSWVNPLDEQRAFSYADHFTQDIVQYVRSKHPNTKSTKQTNNADGFTPLFLNDGMYDQATSLFYRSSVYQTLKTLQAQRDPNGLFSKRTGGAKFT